MLVVDICGVSKWQACFAPKSSNHERERETWTGQAFVMATLCIDNGLTENRSSKQRQINNFPKKLY